MRIWLDPLRMAAHGISASDIQAAIEDNNYQAAPGQIKGIHGQKCPCRHERTVWKGFAALWSKAERVRYVWKTWQQ